MQRVHLVELEDLRWVPAVIRDGGTDLLDVGFERMGFYQGVMPKLLQLIDAGPAARVVDLCSGGGGGALSARDAIRAAGRTEVEVVLTDLYPSAGGAARVASREDGLLTYREQPVDALRVPAELEGVRTMWGALHHFRPEQVSALIEACVRAGQPLGFFDVAASPAIRRMPTPFAPIAMLLNMAMLTVGSLVLIFPGIRMRGPFACVVASAAALRWAGRCCACRGGGRVVRLGGR